MDTVFKQGSYRLLIDWLIGNWTPSYVDCFSTYPPLKRSPVTLFSRAGKCESLSNEVRIVKEGATFVWDCNLNSTRNVSWTLGDDPIDRSRIFPNGSLHVTNANWTSDEGVYCCRELNDRCRQLLVASLCSVDPLEPKEVLIPEGDDYKWPCTVHGSRDCATEIFWTKNGQVVNSTDHQRTLSDGSLHLRNVSADSSPGKYRCCTTNSFGTFCSGKAQFFVSSKYYRDQLL